MGKIFNRKHNDYDIYEAELNAWETLSLGWKDSEGYNNYDYKALAINLRHDYRVSFDREKHFREVFKDEVVNHGGTLRKVLDKYYTEFVEASGLHHQPDFCNTENKIAVCTTETCYNNCFFDFDDYFVTVMNLNGLREKIIDAKNNLTVTLPKWEKLVYDLRVSDYLVNPITFGRWLDERFKEDGIIKGGDHLDVLEVVEGFFELLGHDLKHRPNYHKYPIWVTRWTLFEKFTSAVKVSGDADIDRWNQVVGVNRKFPTWQIIVKYPMNVVESIYRPSQLDGCFYPQHFPPPPLPPRSKFTFGTGGHTVDLVAKNNELLPEFIHQPIALKPEYYQKKIGKAEITHYRVRTPRNHHYKKLSEEYFDNPDEIKQWMEKPI